jgi:hypothetical protein
MAFSASSSAHNSDARSEPDAGNCSKSMAVECSIRASLPPRFSDARFRCGIDQDSPHDLRAHGHEMHPIVPVDALYVDQPEVRLVHERRRLQRMTGALVSHIAVGEVAQLVMEQSGQPIQRSSVAIRPCAQETRDFGRSRHDHGATKVPTGRL